MLLLVVAVACLRALKSGCLLLRARAVCPTIQHASFYVKCGEIVRVSFTGAPRKPHPVILHVTKPQSRSGKKGQSTEKEQQERAKRPLYPVNNAG